MGVRSFLRHALHDLPLAASLAALAAIALPGIGGLVTITLAGVRVDTARPKPVSWCGPRAPRASRVSGRRRGFVRGRERWTSANKAA